MTADSPSTLEGKAKLTLSVPADLIRRAKIRALENSTSVSAVVAAWLEAWASGAHPAIVPAQAARDSSPPEFAALDQANARLREQDTLLNRLRAQARQWLAGGPESGTHGAAVLTELAGGTIRSPAADRQIDPDSAWAEHSLSPDERAALAPEAFSRTGWKDTAADLARQYIMEKIAPPPITRPAPAEPGYHGEGALADFDPGSGRSSHDDWNME